MVFIVAVPLIFAGLVLHFILTGHSLLDADSVLALKVVFTFVAPFAVSIVYRSAQWNDKRNYVVGNHQVFFIGVGLVLLGLVAYPAWDGMKTELRPHGTGDVSGLPVATPLREKGTDAAGVFSELQN